MNKKFILIIVLLALFQLPASAQSSIMLFAQPCPPSGVWPPGCVPNGNNPTPQTPSGNGQPCPSSGVWPPGCVPNGSNPTPQTPSGNGQPCPSSGAWPPGCVPNGSGGYRSIIISFIFYDGVEWNEPDEYAEIHNNGREPINLNGYRLNADDAGEDFRFPNYILQPNAKCRVYTNRIDLNHCGFSFGRSDTPLWSNRGECGRLYDAFGVLIDSYSYLNGRC